VGLNLRILKQNTDKKEGSLTPSWAVPLPPLARGGQAEPAVYQEIIGDPSQPQELLLKTCSFFSLFNYKN
jgi:hypothetical protein